MEFGRAVDLDQGECSQTRLDEYRSLGDDVDRRLAELAKPLNAVEKKIRDTPARTVTGIVAKLRVLSNIRPQDEQPTWDDVLIQGAHAGAEHVMRGPDAVMEVNGPDPLVALYAKWRGLEWRPVPEGMADAEAETFNAQSADLADEVAIEIISASPDTLIGTFTQIALLGYWVKNRAPFRAEDALEQLHGRIETALQDAAGD